jgi:putative MFS transporter
LQGRSLATEWSELRSLFAAPHRRRMVAGSLVWLSIDFWNACAMFSFSFYAQTERSWTPGDVALWFTLGGLLQFVGYAAAGQLIDRHGRRPVVLAYLVLASGASALSYLAHGSLVVAGYLAMNALGGMWAIAQTISAELFPTEIRATAGGLTQHLIGRVGMAAGPKAVGLLAASLGSTGAAVALLGLLHLAALPIIAATLPETRATPLTPPERGRS